MDIVELPRDLFLLVVAHLSARTVVLCRRVSRNWHGTFADPDLNLQLMKWHFPRCREMRVAYLAGALEGNVPDGTEEVHGTADGTVEERESEDRGPANGRKVVWSPDWTVTFANIARRYHHLRTATPWTVEAIKLGSTEQGPSRMFYPVGLWDRFLQLDDKRAPFHYPDPAWSYSQDDGLLVYHSAANEVGHGVDEQTESNPWRLRDLETGHEVVVPFPQGNDRIVRRVRLCDRVLVLEWCEREAYHQLNDREECHRHFVTALDVVRERGTTPGGGGSAGGHTATGSPTTWAVKPRCQFKTHFLGFPLNRHDRFFSAHTSTHYAVYVWQPNRSLYNDDPIESVIVWDISAHGRPRTIRRITWDTLAFYNLRQGSTPRLRSLGMDDRNLYFAEEEHRWAEGGHSSLAPPRVHLVRSTGIPIVVPEPEATSNGTAENAAGGNGDGVEVIIQGPRWVDQCGTNTDVNMPFCTRTNEARFGGMAAQQSTTLVNGENPTDPETWNGNGNTTEAAISSSPPATGRSKGLAGEIEAAIAAGTTRWPGWAPCWRHEDFPYLSVGEVVDFRAGVRVTARHCFMLETLSVHVRPSISVVELGVGGDDNDGVEEDEGGSSSDGGPAIEAVARMRRLERKIRASMAKKKLQKRRVRLGGDGGRNDDGEGAHEEVQFADDMWDRLLGKGCISGDERWLIGEDGKGTLSVVHF